MKYLALLLPLCCSCLGAPTETYLEGTYAEWEGSHGSHGTGQAITGGAVFPVLYSDEDDTNGYDPRTWMPPTDRPAERGRDPLDYSQMGLLLLLAGDRGVSAFRNRNNTS